MFPPSDFPLEDTERILQADLYLESMRLKRDSKRFLQALAANSGAKTLDLVAKLSHLLIPNSPIWFLNSARS